ncbi:MAG: hypothetical protein P1S60_04545 [Anaerolineae bacterium]|nr:hypothetical protein [Anaerolineae bacterium]
MANLLKNPGFEGGWWRKTHTGQEYGEIFTPESWVAFWKEGKPVPHDPSNPNGYGRPEMHIINREPPFLDPLRIRSGERSLKFFTFYRIHMAGIYQRVSGIQIGAVLRATGWAHAWSTVGDDPKISDGVGKQAFFAKTSEYDKTDAVRNFVFEVGIDPKGGTDPWSPTIVWGEGAHIYNAFDNIPAVEVVAASDAVTVFVRSSVLWPFKHCDAYIDDIELTVLDEPQPVEPISVEVTPAEIIEGEIFDVAAWGGSDLANLDMQFVNDNVFTKPPLIFNNRTVWRCVAVAPGAYAAQIVDSGGAIKTLTVNVAERQSVVTDDSDFLPPRVDYERTYVLLAPGSSNAWMQAVIDSGSWAKYRWTVGSSADDAGVGPTKRRVIAVNPQRWPGDLKAFFDDYYPGVELVTILAATPSDLRQVLSSM